METAHTIQQVAQQAGLSIDALLYDERFGLLEPITELRWQGDAIATVRQRTPITPDKLLW